MREKKKSTAYVLLMLSFFGLCGINKFYVGKVGLGIVYLLTLGFFGIGFIVDLFIIPHEVDSWNNSEEKRMKKLARMINEENKKDRGY